MAAGSRPVQAQKRTGRNAAMAPVRLLQQAGPQCAAVNRTCGWTLPCTRCWTPPPKNIIPIELAFFAVFLPPAAAFSSLSRSARMPAQQNQPQPTANQPQCVFALYNQRVPCTIHGGGSSARCACLTAQGGEEWQGRMRRMHSTTQYNVALR